MGRLRSTILLTLIMFCAGFGTAVYLLTPSSAHPASDTPATASTLWSRQLRGGPEVTGEDAQVWAVEMRCAIDKCVRFAEENTLRAADLIRQKTGQSSQ